MRSLRKDRMPSPSGSSRGEESMMRSEVIYNQFERMIDSGASELKIKRFAARANVRRRLAHRHRLVFDWPQLLYLKTSKQITNSRFPLLVHILWGRVALQRTISISFVMWNTRMWLREKIYKTPTIPTTTIHAHSFHATGNYSKFIENPTCNNILFITRLFSGDDFTQTQNFPQLC